MQKFPSEFADLLTPRGLRVLEGRDEGACSIFRKAGQYFVTLGDVVDKKRAAGCMELLDKKLYEHLAVEQRRIAPETITRMKENYGESLHKTMRFKTAFLQRRTARAFRAAERAGLLRMMRSPSFADFAERVAGLPLDRDLNTQVICYGHGDYAGPHNDHHPESESMRDGFVDFHVMFTNGAVAHQYLIYQERGHFSKMVDVNLQGGVSVYRLPFWHYTTPLWGRPGREDAARRWLLLGTFKIVGR
jgi:hypothetical protein